MTSTQTVYKHRERLGLQVPGMEFSDVSSTSGFESQDDDILHRDKSIAKGGVTTPFPWKLHDMLDDMGKEGNETMVCWQPHGRAFMVHKPKEFVEEIMTHYFNQTKYASFQRQLNLYGFSRLSHGRDKGAYYHACFVRGERRLCRGMIRQKIKGTKVRRSLSPEEEPNFYLPEYNRSKTTCRPSPAPSSPIKRQPPVPTPLPHPARMLPLQCTLKPVKKDIGPATSLVSLMKESKRINFLPAILPPPPVIKPFYRPPRAQLASPLDAPPNSVKGGDLLFFEGLPFRYLEHIEDVPRTTSQQPRIVTTYRDTLHDMISSIVKMETSWTDNRSQNVCSV